MGFNKGNKFGNGRGGRRQDEKKNFNRSGFGGGRGNDRPMMHKTKCSDCGAFCEVPFRPTGTKPVFCNDCFRNNRDEYEEARGSRHNERPQESRFDEKPFHHRENMKSTPNYDAQFDQINRKLDKLMGLFEIISSQKPKKAVSPKSDKFEQGAEQEEETREVPKANTVKKGKKATQKKADSKKEKVKKTGAQKKGTKKKEK